MGIVSDRRLQQLAPDLPFETFYSEAWDRLVRRAYLIVGSVAPAEDVVQDVMAELFRRWDRIDNPDAYASRATMNGAVRRANRQDREPLSNLVDARSASVESEFLDDLLQKLPARTRAMLVLKFYEGCTEAQIASITDCRPGTVGPTITRALRRLSTEVER